MPYKICLCADRVYLRHVIQVIKSILDNNTCEYSFYLITDSNAVYDAEICFQKENIFEKITILTIDTSLYSGLKERAHFTTGMYYRLSIPDLIPSEKVLYLDCDITVNGDIEKLFKLDMNDNYVAAVDNQFFSRYDSLGMKPEWGYFNSGVMLINTQAWVDNNIKDRVINFVKENEKSLISPDQDALNYIFAGKWYRLPLKYNAQSVMYQKIFSMRRIKPNQVSQLIDPKIIHFTSSSKPWMKSDAHALKGVYKKYSNIQESSEKGLIWDWAIFMHSLLKYRVRYLIWKYLFNIDS